MGTVRKRSPRFWALWASAGIILGVVMIFGAYMMPVSSDQQVIWSVPGIIVTFSGMFLYSFYWKRLDEAAQEAHKFAWFYGARAAMYALIFGVSFLFGFQAGFNDEPFMQALRNFITNPYIVGGTIVFMTQTIGYLFAWLFWWRSKG